MNAPGAFKAAVVEYLTETAGLDKGSVRIAPKPGKPPPECGDWFIGVHSVTFENDLKTAAQYTLGLSLTVTRRLHEPLDRWDAALDAETDGINEQLGRLVGLLWAGQNLVRARFGQLLADGVDGSSTAPRPVRFGEPDPVTAEWFGATNETGQKGVINVYGLTGTVQYVGLGVIHPWDTAQL